jgi:hypothetical protein
VAEPYKQLSWEGIKKWAKLRNATLQPPRIDRPSAPTVDPKNPEKVIVHIDPSRYMGKPADVVECWMVYSITRADYLKERELFLLQRVTVLPISCRERLD